MKTQRMQARLIPVILAAAASCVVAQSATAATERLDLSGKWRVQLHAKPVDTAWLADQPAATAKMPGSLTTNGLGAEISDKTPWMGNPKRELWNGPRYAEYKKPGNYKVPCFLQPIKYFSGAACYQKDVEIPVTWQGKRIVLNLERCHWGTRVWVDDKAVPGQDLSLCTPHRHDLSALLSPGKHTVTVEVDNRYLVNVGADASSVTDHSQTNWNGFVGETALVASDPVWISELQVYPDFRNKTAKIVAMIANSSGMPCAGELVFAADYAKGKSEVKKLPFACDGKDVKLELNYALGAEAPLWDEFSPNLITLRTTLAGKAGTTAVADHNNTRFGLREIAADGRQLTVNGRPAFFRGTLDCMEYPLTGHPAMDAAWWRKQYATCKAFGLNHVRFHSSCPPKVAFEVADEMGMYLQVECGAWVWFANLPPGAPVQPWLLEEGKRVLREYGNHPSFTLFVHGNEPNGLNWGWLDKTWIPEMTAVDSSRHLTAAAAHYPVVPNNQYENIGEPLRLYGSQDRQPGALRDFGDFILKQKKPVVAHETGEWCAFPNLKEATKYTGVLKNTALEITADFMRRNHMLDQADAFLMASGKFQTLTYKEETEIFRRTKSLGGYQMLGLNDFSGQGTALVGAVDPFWDAKPYVTAGEYRRFNGSVVPLAYLAKRTFTADETLHAPVSISQFSAAAIMGCAPQWTITRDDGSIFAKGELPARDIAVGQSDLGEITCPLAAVREAAHLRLTVALPGTDYANDWSFWVYPKTQETVVGSVRICNSADEALDLLAQGQRVLWLPTPSTIQGNTRATFAPIFWNKLWFPGQPAHSLGLLIQDKHPALAGFPTASHADMQWWDPMMHGKPAILDGLPPELRPIVQPIDDWNSCRRLGLLFEAKVGNSKLMFCTVDLQADMAKRPVARQLLASILRYMNSSAFAPQTELSAEQLGSVVRHNPIGKSKITAASAHPSCPATHAIDGDSTTLWHSNWQDPAQRYPYTLTLELPQTESIRAINFQPRQDGNPNGRVKTVKLETSNDGKSWNTTIAEATLVNNAEWQTVALTTPVKASHLRITLLSPQDPNQSFASMAEITITKE